MCMCMTASQHFCSRNVLLTASSNAAEVFAFGQPEEKENKVIPFVANISLRNYGSALFCLEIVGAMGLG